MKHTQKPLGMNSREVSEMIECARRNDVYLLEATWTRFFPAVLKAREVVTSGAIGNVVMYSGNFGSCVKSADTRPRLWQNDMGGGSILDIGCYTLHHLPLWFGPRMPKTIKAVGYVGE